MKNSALPADDFQSEDDLKASSHLLKLKLETEYNITISDTGHLPPEIENKWLENIYNFEKQHRNSKPVKVKELLGNPFVGQHFELSDAALHEELKRVKNMMSDHHIALDCCVEYDERIIYKFITEELFEFEIENVVVEGMTWHFIYEEFYPNHSYDLERFSTQFIDTLLTRKWNEDYDVYKLSKVIMFKGKEVTQNTISSIIQAFQAAHNFFEIQEVVIYNVIVDIESKTGHVDGKVTYVSYPREETARKHIGPVTFDFMYDGKDWEMSGFSLPGLG